MGLFIIMHEHAAIGNANNAATHQTKASKALRVVRPQFLRDKTKQINKPLMSGLGGQSSKESPELFQSNGMSDGECLLNVIKTISRSESSFLINTRL